MLRSRRPRVRPQRPGPPAPSAERRDHEDRFVLEERLVDDEARPDEGAEGAGREVALMPGVVLRRGHDGGRREQEAAGGRGGPPAGASSMIWPASSHWKTIAGCRKCVRA